MGYITGTKDITISNAGCGNVNPIAIGCTIKPHQSSVSHTNTAATYKVVVDSYANASLALVYIASQTVTIKVVSPGPRSAEPLYNIEISEPYIDSARINQNEL